MLDQSSQEYIYGMESEKVAGFFEMVQLESSSLG